MAQISKSKARRLMLEADRDRARIAYRGLRESMTDAQERALLERNRNTAEYRLADRRFRRYAAVLDDRGPTALGRLL